jgi:hypothetical protein
MENGSRPMPLAIYFDDEYQLRDEFAQRLSNTELLLVQAAAPPSDLELAPWLAQDPDAFLVDYELAGTGPHTEAVNYRGGTLAAALRERARDIPIVLMTRRTLLQWQDDRRMLDTLQVFDGVVFKGDVEGDPRSAAGRIVSIAAGFRDLAAVNNNFEGLIAALRARPGELGELREAGAPLDGWEVPEVARWLRGVLIRFPGILYDRLHVAAVLGVDPAGIAGRLDEWLADAEYTGPLGRLERRWWKARVLERAVGIQLESGLPGPLYAVFADVWRLQMTETLAVAPCNYGDEGPADSTCFVLKEPVHRQHSLAYFPDQRPAVMDQARASFKAIRESNDVEDDFIDPSAASLVTDLREER